MKPLDERQYRIHSKLFLRRVSQEIGGRSSRHAVLLKIRILKTLQTYELQYLHVRRYFFFFVSIICFLKGFFNDVFQRSSMYAVLIMFSTKCSSDFKARRIATAVILFSFFLAIFLRFLCFFDCFRLDFVICCPLYSTHTHTHKVLRLLQLAA